MQANNLTCVLASLRSSAISRRAVWPMTVILCLTVAMFCAVGEANGHEFADGFVERSVAVVAREDVARLEYSIGLNPNTKGKLIEFWQSTDRGPNQPGTAHSAATRPTQSQADFYQLAADHLSRRLEIAVNNERIRPRLISALPSSRHHVDVTVTLEFTLPTADTEIPITIEIADGNFFRKRTQQQKVGLTNAGTFNNIPQPSKPIGEARRLLPAPFGGGFRYAFKTRGSTILNSSNVASILIRADRHIDADFNAAELESACRIKAKVSNILTTQDDQRR